jgi:ParB family chromosome partitioning protein
MDNKSSVLGKGLSAIFTEKNVDVKSVEDTGKKGIDEIYVNKIKENPLQPREDFDDEKLKELADSIKQNGLIQPITVKKDGNNYILISGERRLRAVKMVGLEKVRAYIYEKPTTALIAPDANENLLELALIENIQREDLNPMELSDSYKRLLDEYNLTQEQVAEKVSKQRSTVANYLRLQNLPVEIKVSIRKNEISESHARMLLRVDNTDDQLILWKRIIKENISVKNLEEMTKSSVKKQRVKKLKLGEIYDPYFQNIEDKLRKFFGTKVTIKRKSKYSGEVIIDYFSSEDLERIIEKCDR